MWYCCKCNGGGISGFSYMVINCTKCDHLRCGKCDMRIDNVRVRPSKDDWLSPKERDESRKVNDQKHKEQREANKKTVEEEHTKFSMTNVAMTAPGKKKEAGEWWRQGAEGLIESIPGIVTRGKKKELALRQATGESSESILVGHGRSSRSSLLRPVNLAFRTDKGRPGGQNGWGTRFGNGLSDEDCVE